MEPLGVWVRDKSDRPKETINYVNQMLENILHKNPYYMVNSRVHPKRWRK